MKKWKCMNRECGENCIVESKKFHPANCPMFTENFHLQADWREVTEPVTESNQLPKLLDWCKVGEYGYAYDSGYFKIVEIIDGGRNLKVDWVKEGVQGTVFGCNIKNKKQARLRPYNADEMKALVGKVTKDTQGNISFITGYCAHKEVVYSGTTNFTAECLLISCRFLDNAPCGVLEHMDNGEWVE